ncbi:MAG TPA: hypothetical protein VGQ83_43350 [Polyangia bacterium]
MRLLGRALVDRLRRPPARAADVAAVRRRLRAQAGPRRATTAERAVAGRMRDLRVALSRALGSLQACGRCGVGHPPPHGQWAGGFCCGAPTEVIFTDEELAALRLSGTTPRRLRVLLEPAAGCAFRGPAGCALAPADRAAKCARYLCRDVVRELHARGDLAAIELLAEELHTAYTRFVALRAARLDDEAVGLR